MPAGDGVVGEVGRAAVDLARVVRMVSLRAVGTLSSRVGEVSSEQ